MKAYKNLEERVNLVKRNTVEVLTDEELVELLKTKKQPTVYHGRAITGPLHIGHLIPLGKLFDFNRADIKVKILLADIHAALDDLKSKWEDLDKRAEYTRKCIELSFDWPKKLNFVKGSDFQLEKNYVMDIWKIATIATVVRTTRAASEVTRMKNPKTSELVYPIMQALDEQYLDADIQLGGTDQRHIMAFAREYLPKIGYKKRVEIMTPLSASLLGSGTKMSSSIPASVIKVYDSEESIKKKINKSYCPAKIVENNPIIQIASMLIIPIDGKLSIKRDKKFGGDIDITSSEQLEKLFVNGELHPADLKNAVTTYLINKFKPVRNYFEKNTDILKDLGNEFLP
ncbi:MAG: tyrosine--tRNA ligase [Candidatus Aenigmatarchaeota archaeon]